MLETQVRDLRTELFWTKMKTQDHEYATFTPGSSGYGRVDTVSGNFFIAVTNFKPYANGYRLTAQIGNPNAATYSNATLKVKWGKPFDYKSGVPYDDWQKSLPETVATAKQLRPGTWTKVPVTLSPAAAEETGYVQIAMETDMVMLLLPR